MLRTDETDSESFSGKFCFVRTISFGATLPVRRCAVSRTCSHKSDAVRLPVLTPNGAVTLEGAANLEGAATLEGAANLDGAATLEGTPTLRGAANREDAVKTPRRRHCLSDET